MLSKIRGIEGSGQWSVVSGQWSVVSGQWSVVSGQWSVVSGQWSVNCNTPQRSNQEDWTYAATGIASVGRTSCSDTRWRSGFGRSLLQTYHNPKPQRGDTLSNISNENIRRDGQELVLIRITYPRRNQPAAPLGLECVVIVPSIHLPPRWGY